MEGDRCIRGGGMTVFSEMILYVDCRRVIEGARVPVGCYH